jgi:hypothetical protein
MTPDAILQAVDLTDTAALVRHLCRPFRAEYLFRMAPRALPGATVFRPFGAGESGMRHAA